MRNIIITLALVLLPGALKQPASTEETATAAQQSASAGKPAPKSNVVTPTDAPVQRVAGMSTCYFCRPRLCRGSAVRIGIFVDGTMAVNLVNGRWASIQLPADHHVLKPKDDQSGIEIDMEPGQSYYIRSGWGEVRFFHRAHKNIMLMIKEQANYETKQLKPLDDKDITWGKPNAAAAQ
jgi:hypothetical protein